MYGGAWRRHNRRCHFLERVKSVQWGLGPGSAGPGPFPNPKLLQRPLVANSSISEDFALLTTHLQVYLTTLEWTKSEVGKSVAGLGLTEPTIAGVSNFFGGALASLATQSVTVPIDVISQKQMVHGDETVVARQQHSRAGPGQGASAGQGAPAVAGHATGTGATAATGTGAAAAGETAAAARASGGASTSGRGVSTAAAAEAAAGKRAGSGVVRIGPLQMVRLIVKEEGVAGLYRGFGASVATFVPSSAVWWGAYGAYQKLIWTLLYGSGSSTADAGSRGNNSSSSGSAAGSGGSGTGAGAGLADLAGGVPPGHSTGEVVAVQTTASVLAGCTSSIATTPLDLIKVGRTWKGCRVGMERAVGWIGAWV